MPFIDITNSETLNNHLNKLAAGTLPLWGVLTPQKMVEHLVESIEYSNGKKQTTCNRSAADIEKAKQIVIYSDAAIPMGIKTPGNRGDKTGQQFKNLPDAIRALHEALAEFEEYYRNPGATAIHPGFGILNGKEWQIFHGKHFTHHFKQFDLLP